MQKSFLLFIAKFRSVRLFWLNYWMGCRLHFQPFNNNISPSPTIKDGKIMIFAGVKRDPSTVWSGYQTQKLSIDLPTQIFTLEASQQSKLFLSWNYWIFRGFCVLKGRHLKKSENLSFWSWFPSEAVLLAQWLCKTSLPPTLLIVSIF